MLVVLRPLLHQTYPDVERRRNPVARLTARHRDLSRLLAVGQSSARIARSLGLSEGAGALTWRTCVAG
jgi:DNA-binding CsgD family transcriptional regulator